MTVKKIKPRATKKVVRTTTTTINGKKYPNHYRAKDGSIKKAPKGKYIDSFGKTRSLPKKKK